MVLLKKPSSYGLKKRDPNGSQIWLCLVLSLKSIHFGWSTVLSRTQMTVPAVRTCYQAPSQCAPSSSFGDIGPGPSASIENTISHLDLTLIPHQYERTSLQNESV